MHFPVDHCIVSLVITGTITIIRIRRISRLPCIISVQYTGGCSVHWGISFSTLGNIIEYTGDVQYTEGISLSTLGGVQYTGDIMSTLEGVQYTGGYHEYIGGYHDECGGIS